MTPGPPISRPISSALKLVLTLVLIALVYGIGAKLGLLFSFQTKQVTAIWPPTGIAVAALWYYGIPTWPAIFFGALLVNANLDEPFLTAAGIAVGNTLGPVLVVYTLRKVARFDAAFERVRDVVGLILCGMLGASITASNGILNLSLSGIVPWTTLHHVWWIWWIGDFMGILLLAPLLLSWSARPYLHYTKRQVIELAILFITFSAYGWFILSGGVFDDMALRHHKYAVFPFLIWTALRFGTRETATLVALSFGFTAWGAIHGRGSLAAVDFDQRIIVLELFTAIVSLTGFFLAAASNEKRRAQLQALAANVQLHQRNEELLRLNRIVEKANQELSRKNKEVEEFVYIVSHDLRSPLVTLRGFSQELGADINELQGKIDQVQVAPEMRQQLGTLMEEGVRGSLKYIEASAIKFQRLIDALLHLSRTGVQELKIEYLNMKALVDSTLKSLGHVIGKSQATIVVHELPDVCGDATAMGQVFSNLISNALRYLAPERPGVIEIGGEKSGPMVQYWVRDNGLGIPERAQARLFQVFQRFHAQKTEGEGIGLAMVKKIVERHGGRIWADSQENVGSTFYVSLPSQSKTESS